MTLFNDIFRKTVEKEKLGSKRSFEIEYSTGFDLIDYYNGSMLPSKKCRLGFEGGRYAAFVGPSGGGKSSLAIQMAWNMVKGYENSNFFLIDKERSTSKERILNLTRMSEADYNDRVFHIRDEFYSETLYKLVRHLNRSKIEKFNDIKVSYTDKVTGQTHDVLPPSVIVLDSLPMLTPLEISGEIGDGDKKDELDGNMVAAQIAKVNAGIFRRILPLLDSGNIFLFVINHMSSKIVINPYARQTKQLNYMGENEHLAGGNKCIYLANYLFKTSPGKQLKKDDDFFIKGFMVNIEFIKSRGAAAGTMFQMVFDQVNGFDNILSNFNYLVTEKQISGGGKSSYIEGMNDATFTKKTVKALASKNKEFRKHLIKTTRSHLIEHVVPVAERVAKEWDSSESKSEEATKKKKKSKK